MRKFVILGTAGHIDHGKTALVKKLTGIDTDRWKEEKSRGMTIDIGFAKLELPDGEVIGIVDVPGHERFIKNMLAGAHGIDIVLLVIASDEGVMPQTKEHVAVCEALGVKGGIVVLTKTDTVDREWLELVKEDVKSYLKGTLFENAPIVPVSSKTGEGIDRLLEEISKLSRKVKSKPLEGIFRLPVDRSFSIKGFGTVVTGTVLSGRVRVGDTVTVYPGRVKVKVRGIQSHDKPVEEARAGQRAALNLSDISKDDVKRGDLISNIDFLLPTKLVDVKLAVSPDSDFPVSSGQRVHFHHLTSEIEGEVFLVGRDELLPGEMGYAQIRLSREIFPLFGDRFVIRYYSPARVIGGGVILDPLPERRFRRKFSKEWEEKLSVFERGDRREMLRFLAERAGLRGIDKTSLLQRLNLLGEELKSTINSCTECVEAGERVFSKDLLEELVKKATSTIDRFHRDYPLLPGMNKESLRTTLSVDGELFSRVIDRVLETGEYVDEEGILKRKGFKPYVEGTDFEEAYRKVKSLIEKAGFKPPEIKEIPRILSIPEDRVSPVISFLTGSEGFVRFGDFLISGKTLERVKAILCSHFSRKERLTVGELKDYLSVTRKHVIPLLEFLDRMGILSRSGNERLRGEKLTC